MNSPVDDNSLEFIIQMLHKCVGTPNNIDITINCLIQSIDNITKAIGVINRLHLEIKNYVSSYYRHQDILQHNEVFNYDVITNALDRLNEILTIYNEQLANEYKIKDYLIIINNSEHDTNTKSEQFSAKADAFVFKYGNIINCLPTKMKVYKKLPTAKNAITGAMASIMEAINNYEDYVNYDGRIAPSAA